MEKPDSENNARDVTEQIYVTKSFLPDREEYFKKVTSIFDTHTLTNQGPLLRDLEETISQYLKVKHFHYVSNGTIALQLALAALDINDGEVITTPFSYVATTSSILWQRCKPVFVDIETDNFTLDSDKIEQAITSKTKAIMPVHVFGYMANVDQIDAIAERNGLRVIYDAAHAFGAEYQGRSLASYGDISTCSFHATKLFHTVEGGACIVKDEAISRKLDLQKRFGHVGDQHFCLGINAKQSELHAAMGLANFPYLDEIIAERRRLSEVYDAQLANVVRRPKLQDGLKYNYAYYPVLFNSEKDLLRVFKSLNETNVFPRRYFYPSLNTLPYIERYSCPLSENISTRIACLPIYPGLAEEHVMRISRTIRDVLS